MTAPRIICPNCFSSTRFWNNCEICFTENVRTLPKKGKIKTSAIPSANYGMDPHLIRLLSLPSIQTGAVTLPDELQVIARVSSLDKFEKEVGKDKIGIRIKGDEFDPTWLITARVPASKVLALHKKEYVLSLKAARRLRPLLEKTLQNVRANTDTIPMDSNSGGGAGVIVGIVDFGLDFCHRNFLDENGQTRINLLWDQMSSSTCGKPSPLGYGRVFDATDINKALRTAAPYQSLGYQIPLDSEFETGSHGTYVTDVAVGNGAGTGQSGVAPAAEIVFVDIANGKARSNGNLYSNLIQILEAVWFIFDYAEKKNLPCVINISLGTNSGPHDGTSLVEQGLDRLLKGATGRAIVTAAGNSTGKGMNASGQLSQAQTTDLLWNVAAQDRTLNELDLWYAGCDSISVEIVAPDGRRIKGGPVKPGWNRCYDYGTHGIVTVVNRANDPNNHRNNLAVFIEGGVAGGTWKIRLKGDRIQDGRFQAWIERDEGGQSVFISSPSVSSEGSTLSSLACGQETISVGGYNAGEPATPSLTSSATGPTMDLRLKPDISAPGAGILAAQSCTGVLRRRYSGTSLSAPVVTGIIALMMAEAEAKGIRLTARHISQILSLTARKPESMTGNWHPQYGHGMVNAAGALAVVRSLEASPETRVKKKRPSNKK